MQILAIDTASPRPAVSLLIRGTLFEEPLPSDRRSSEELLPALARALAAGKVRLADCQRLAVCAGPGSFTGIRIGLATAWGLGRAAGIPVESVSTLECLVEAARPSGAARLAAVLDAGRGELIVQRFALEPGRARPLAPAVRVCADRIHDVAAGDPILELPAGLTGADALVPSLAPASGLALAVAREPRETASAELRASYSRPSAAEAAREAATAKEEVKRGLA